MRKFEKVVMFMSLTLLVLGLAFGAGFVFRQSSAWLQSDIRALSDQIKVYRRFGHWGRPFEFMDSDAAEDEPRARLVQPDLAMPGYRAFLGYDRDLSSYSVRLFDTNAEQIHVWPVDYHAFLPDSPAPIGANAHGMQIFPDGSLAVVFEAGGTAMIRMDACGEPMWITEGFFHHSITPGDDGLLWSWLNRSAGLGHREGIVAVNPDTGAIEREIPLEDVAKAFERNAINMAIAGGFTFQQRGPYPRGVIHDIFHTNDVEPLSAAMADAFPQFEAGDLLLSLRNLNYVAVLDPDTLELKWGQHGPWIRQHDPDFTAAGRIEVYNNNTGRGRSSITSIDPQTGDTQALFATGENPYYSGPQGKQQQLANGNYLILVADEGRAIELSSDGQKVFEYKNMVRDGVSGRMFNSQWLPEDFFDTVPSCSQ